MGLGNFYKDAELMIVNKLTEYLMKDDVKFRKIKLLNINMSENIGVKEYLLTTNLEIGNNPQYFLDNINKFLISLKGEHYHIINCRFTAKYFMTNVQDFYKFMSFILSILKPKGILMGFLLDNDKLNGIFSEKTSLRRGSYKLKYITTEQTDHFVSNKILINDEPVTIFNFTTLEYICNQFGLVHLRTIILEKFYYDALNYLSLSKNEKMFGFLNYVFLFQKQ